MTDIWYISAELKHVAERRIIIYKMDKAEKNARANLGDMLLWCRDPCEQLLKDLETKKANARDTEFVKKEIDFLKEIENKWRTQYKKW